MLSLNTKGFKYTLSCAFQLSARPCKKTGRSHRAWATPSGLARGSNAGGLTGSEEAIENECTSCP